jgi:hypothetical protein
MTRNLILIGVAVLIAAGAVYELSGWTRQEHWTSAEDTDYIDSYGYWSGELQRRWVTSHSPDGTVGIIAWGPMSASGRPHGEWTQLSPDQPPSVQFFWYGEEVTEGEWKKRSK